MLLRKPTNSNSCEKSRMTSNRRFILSPHRSKSQFIGILGASRPFKGSGRRLCGRLSIVLVGAMPPSGHLPATFERWQENNPTSSSCCPSTTTAAPFNVEYRDGIFVGYRGHQKNRTPP